MSTFTQIYYHIVFSTKNREPVLLEKNRSQLFKEMTGILKNKQCRLYRINGVDDHIHILTGLHPSLALADLVSSLKTSAGSYIKSKGLFPNFTYWQEGYGAFTCSHSVRDSVIDYINNQKVHHRKISFKDELRNMLVAAGIEFEEKYLV